MTLPLFETCSAIDAAPTATDYPYVVTVHRPGLPHVHLGYSYRHQAKQACRSLTGDLRHTRHVEGTSISWSSAPTGVSVLPPVPTDVGALAELIAQEDQDQPPGHAFPGLYSRLKAQQGYDVAASAWAVACQLLDREVDESAPVVPSGGGTDDR